MRSQLRAAVGSEGAKDPVPYLQLARDIERAVAKYQLVQLASFRRPRRPWAICRLSRIRIWRGSSLTDLTARLKSSPCSAKNCLSSSTPANSDPQRKSALAETLGSAGVRPCAASTKR